LQGKTASGLPNDGQAVLALSGDAYVILPASIAGLSSCRESFNKSVDNSIKKMMRRLLLILSVYSIGGVFSSVFALQGESIYIKAIAGGAYTMVSETADDIKLSFKGISGIGYLQVGGALNRSFKVFGFTGVAMAPGPKVTTENLKIDTVYSTQTIFDLGLGAAYYLKGGQYISLGASIAQNYYKFNVYGVDVGTYTRHGWGSNILLGQEFPLSPRFSLGVSAIGYYGQVYDVGQSPFQDAPVTNIYAGLVVSLTYD
jgi:hypothetical protein